MSRSYKKNPIIKYAPKSGKIGKRVANKRVRRTKGKLPNGYAYLKKIYDPWDIHDCCFRQTLAEAFYLRDSDQHFFKVQRYMFLSRHEISDTECIRKWKKSFYWK